MQRPNSHEEFRPQPSASSPGALHTGMSTSTVPRFRSEDSWIEVSSRPSSSSLSSAADEVITTGLRVRHDSAIRRRRRLRRTWTDDVGIRHHTSSAGGSSQEEYEESESESDRVMSSSNEAVQPSPLRDEWKPNYATSTASSDNLFVSGEDDDDENATAVGIAPSRQRFVPAPNAFSHPPSSQRSQASSLPQPGHRPRAASQRHSYSAQGQHSPYNIISPSHRADHDAALRASLSTLLSCAAAARGLPKSNQQSNAQQRPLADNRIQPSTIGIMPESMILGGSPEPSASCPAAEPEKAKRKSAAAGTATRARSASRDRRVSKKVRRSLPVTSSMEDVSPTLLTWVVGAGVLVLVSAISFSAGYSAGREVGRAEAAGLSDVGTGLSSCGKDLATKGSGLGLRRWSAAAAGVSA